MLRPELGLDSNKAFHNNIIISVHNKFNEIFNLNIGNQCATSFFQKGGSEDKKNSSKKTPLYRGYLRVRKSKAVYDTLVELAGGLCGTWEYCVHTTLNDASSLGLF